MLAILLLFSALSLPSTTPAEIPSSGDGHVPLVLFGRTLPDNRTTQEIVWSCLATIFACTWVAIHPNLPGPWDSGWQKSKRRVLIMVYGMLAPEFVTLWAMRQRIAAQRIAKEFNERNERRYWCIGGLDIVEEGLDNTAQVPWYLCLPNALKEGWEATKSTMKEYFRRPDRNAPSTWTLTHGFFIQMGGFMLCAGKVPVRVLNFKKLVSEINGGYVEAPDILESEIEDKSKGDFLTKLVVVVQTSWFVIQCLARWASHLPVTELEVVTLAFSILNVITYALWWKKPQNVLVAVRIPLKDPEQHSDRNVIYGDEDGKEATADTAENKKSMVTKDLKKAASNGLSGWLLEVPVALLGALINPLFKMGADSTTMVWRSYRESMFAADWKKDDAVLFPLMGISLVFGSLHLIPWSSSTFPTTTEHWFWRISALLITVYPVITFLGRFVLWLHYRFDISWISAKLIKSVVQPAAVLVGLPLYIIARLTLISLAFSTLRHLPPEAYANVQWTTFVPHLM